MESSAHIDESFKLKAEHYKTMTDSGCNLERLVSFRKDIHTNAELAFKEFETSKKVKQMLLDYGLDEDCIKSCAGTGLVVDIKGIGPESQEGINMIALRADMDALPIPENNPTLSYKTITDCAHMCGHDGHMATLLSTAEVIIKHRDRIPKGKVVRLLFQPAEEGPGGALPMIKEGCLEGVDEVYGYHNMPNFDEGDVRVCEGAIMAKSTIVKITVNGQGGHGSVPHMIQDVVGAGATILSALHTIKSRCIDSKENFIFTLTQFTSGHTYNVFPDSAFMQGTIRSYNDKTLDIIKAKIRLIAENTAIAVGCTADVYIKECYPAVVNHKIETQHVVRVAERYFGKDKVKTQDLPLTASEDFSYYLLEKPGCFFMLGIKVQGQNYCLHTSFFDYNDSMIASGGLLFVRIVEDRLAAKIIY